jgi:hypothetical protein
MAFKERLHCPERRHPLISHFFSFYDYLSSECALPNVISGRFRTIKYHPKKMEITGIGYFEKKNGYKLVAKYDGWMQEFFVKGSSQETLENKVAAYATFHDIVFWFPKPEETKQEHAEETKEYADL